MKHINTSKSTVAARALFVALALFLCLFAAQFAQAQGMMPIYRADGAVAYIPTEHTKVLKTIASTSLVPTLIVTKTADTNDGVCNADCSLREAMDAADSNGVPDVIGFNIPASDAGCAGDACVIGFTDHIEPSADGGNLTTIDGYSGATKITLDGQLSSRHFRVTANVKLAMNDLTLRRGDGTGSSGNDVGGSIVILGAGSELTLNKMTFSNNDASDGGAIHVSPSGTLTMTNSTVSNNSSDNTGGGIFISPNGAATLTNVTVSGNSSDSAAGINNSGSLNATSLTVANNSARFSGGIFTNVGSTTNIRNSIVTGNDSPSSPDVGGNFNSGGYNFISINDGSNFVAGNPNANNDIVGTLAAPQNPQLMLILPGSVNDTTKTHALFPTSPAIDKGNSFGTTQDQRGVIRPFDNPAIANAPGGDGADIGAFELRTEADLAVSLVVSPDPVARGGNLTYQITLTNNGNTAAQSVVLRQSDSFTQSGGSLPTVVSIAAPPNFACQQSFSGVPVGEVVCQGASLGAGQSAQFTIVRRVPSGNPPGIVINHEAGATTSTLEANTTNNRATETTLVQ